MPDFLHIDVSKDGQAWREARSIPVTNLVSTDRIDFDGPTTARFLAVRAVSSKSNGIPLLTFDEIEIYPPGKGLEPRPDPINNP